jgi:F-type H+-transporting ATPase subunit delta
MKINPKKYATALIEMLEGADEKQSKKIISDFAQDLVRNNESFKLEKIIREFSLLFDTKYSIINVSITSASDLTLESEKTLNDYIKNNTKAKEVNIKKSLDASIIGGVVIRYGDKIFNASLRNQLNKLKESLLKS